MHCTHTHELHAKQPNPSSVASFEWVRERERERCERRSEDWGLKERENQRKYDMERDRECGVGDGERKY